MSSQESGETNLSRAQQMERIRGYVIGGLDVGIACWTGIDLYGRTLAPGPRLLWACLAGLLVFCTLTFIWKRQAAIRRAHDDGQLVGDARGVRRPVAHTDSAGVLARELPPEARRDLRGAAASNFFTQYSFSNWQVVVPIVALVGALVVGYWGAAPPIQVYFPITISALMGTGYTTMPRSMADAYLRHGYCPSCAYRLVEVPRQEDGCTICPECEGAWRVSGRGG